MEKENSQQAYTQKMFANPFSFNGRIRRLEYGISYIIYLFLHGVIKSLMFLANDSIVVAIIVLVLSALAGWFILVQGAKRCHDRGNSGWYQIIPFYVFWMLLADGDDYDNGYGPDPKGRNSLAEIEAALQE